MSKIPYKPDINQEADEDYEIVSFEDFCDKSGGSKTDLLTLNDNINYRLCYERDKGLKYEGSSSSKNAGQRETPLDGRKNVGFKSKTSGPFAPFGRYNGRAQKVSLFGGVIPKARNEENTGVSDPPRYQRFSPNRSFFQRVWDYFPGMTSSILGLAIVCALCVGVWWAVCGALGGAWGEEHYRKLWERAHPDNFKKPLSPVNFEKSIIKTPPMITQSETVQVPQGTEHRYHDHNNLSTKNKNATIDGKKNKKKFVDLTSEQQKDVCSDIPLDTRIDCLPFGNETACLSIGCCWKVPGKRGPPYCFYPPGYDSFKFVNMTENKHGMRLVYTKGRSSGYPGDFDNAVVDIRYLSEDTLQIKIYDPDRKRFEVPIPQIPQVPGTLTKLKYRVQVDVGSIGFKVIRNSDNVTVVNTLDVGGLILSEKFLQISTQLPTDRIFGLGEYKATLKRNINWKTYTLYNRDHWPMFDINLYGSHPFYMAVENDGNTHGMLLLNSNAIDVVLQPSAALTYRALGGILHLLVFLGPTPRQVVRQYTAAIGRPAQPPYWALGFHLCKYGYHSVDETRRIWKKNRDAGLPFDTQWNDIDYMHNQNDFTYDQKRFGGLPDFVKELHEAGMHYVIILDPGVSASEPLGSYPPYDRGLQRGLFVRNSSGLPYTGRVWNPEATVFPDFTHPRTTGYWVELMTDFHKKINYDGAWIDMNEPSNLISGQIYGRCAPENLPYKPANYYTVDLNMKSLCLDAKHYIGPHSDVHNLYGLYEAVATNFALQEIRGKRPFVISRASFPGLGRYAGHWGGDVQSTWEDMRYTIPGLLSFSLFGIPMMGSDICGFGGDTSVQLCKRWMQLGAFYPFSRNHADLNSKPQDPASMGPEVLNASITALRLRYRLLPYYYTLFWHAHTKGDTVATPLFFLHPEDRTLDAIDTQFLIGYKLMITPILEENTNYTNAYYPGEEKWYNVVDGEYLATDQRRPVTDRQMVAVQGGAILPLQEPNPTGPVSTSLARSRPLQLLAAPGAGRRAQGDLYWDDGDSINSYEERKYSYIAFSLKDEVLTSEVIWWGYGVPSIDNITIFAQTRPIKAVSVNGNKAQFEYNDKLKTLTIHDLNLNLDKPFTVKWVYQNMLMKKITNSLDFSRKINNKSDCKAKESSEND